jgi:hypothetical protein
VPDAAAGLAEVAAGDADELVAPGIAQHALEERPAGRLALGTLLQLDARAGQTGRERVADALELAEAQDVRPPGAAGRAARRTTDERVGQLRLQPRDLPTQLGPGGALVGDRR